MADDLVCCRPCDDEIRYIPRSGPMFSGGSVAKADMATNLAIPLLAERGWSALTLRNVARASNVTPQAIAAWFAFRGRDARGCWRDGTGNGGSASEAVWPAGGSCSGRSPSSPSRLPQVALALLPQTWLEQVYDGVWLTLVEAARWGEALSREVSTIEEAERDLVADLLHDLGEVVTRTGSSATWTWRWGSSAGCGWPSPHRATRCRRSAPPKCWSTRSAA